LEARLYAAEYAAKLWQRAAEQANAREEIYEAALKPFADALHDWGDDPASYDWSDAWEHPIAMNVTVGDFRRAASAIEAAAAGETADAGSTVGESAARQGDAQSTPGTPHE